MKRIWTKSRVAEFERLEQLLNECLSLNSGNQITNRIARIEKLAELLSRPRRLKRTHTSFLSFLRDVAGDDLSKHPPLCKPKEAANAQA